MIARLRSFVDAALERTLVVLVAAMVLNVVWQVATRFVLREPSAYTEELARFLLIWTGLLGACLAWRRRMHLAIRLFGAAMADPPARWLQLVTLISSALLFVFVFIVGGGRLVWLSFELEQRSAALGWSLGYVYLAIPLSGLVLLVYILSDFFEGRRA